MSAAFLAVPALMVLLAHPTPLHAQEAPVNDAAPGSTAPSNQAVRVTLASPGSGHRRVTGLLTAESADSLVLYQPRDEQVVVIARSEVTRVEVATGRSSRVGSGALMGMAIGAGTGLMLGVVASNSTSDPFVGGGSVGGVALGGALAGMLMGAFIGSLSHKVTWEDRTSINVSPASVSLSVKF